MTTDLLLELFTGFLTAIVALWIILLNRTTLPDQPSATAVLKQVEGTTINFTSKIESFLKSYFLKEGLLANLGLLILRLAIGAMMIHHGQEKLADPQVFANNYVIPLHIPFPLFFANVAGYSEVIGSWMLILGIFSPLGAMALMGTMTVAAYHHILFSGLNIYVLELVVLYLGGSLALLLMGPGKFSFDAGIVQDLISSDAADTLTTSDELSATSPTGYATNAG